MSEKPKQSTLSKPIGNGAASNPASVGRRLWPYLKPLIWVSIAAILTLALVAATEAGIPALLKPLLDHGFGTKGSPSAMWIVPVAIIGLALVRGLAQYASGYLLQYVSNRILLELRLKMFERMIHASVGFFQRETASTVINAIVFEVNQILSVLMGVLVTSVRDSLTVFFLLGYLFILNWRLTLIVAVLLPAIGWLVSKINRRLRRLNREHQLLTNELSYIVV
ncbi:ABC transporter transmembrane domain-containing protein, partial [Paraburkholderia tropica]|uniref:ABC transporter transmembrane domain-containing protein n=1 Tax=Paraburkholderia tropica TaxID=92647 RepID=UPI000A64CA43